MAGICQRRKLRLREGRSRPHSRLLGRGEGSLSIRSFQCSSYSSPPPSNVCRPLTHHHSHAHTPPPPTHTCTHTGVAASTGSAATHLIQLTCLCWVHLEALAGDNMFLASPRALSVRDTRLLRARGCQLPSSPAAPSPWETMDEANYLAFFSFFRSSRCWTPSKTPTPAPQSALPPDAGCQAWLCPPFLEGPF